MSTLESKDWYIKHILRYTASAIDKYYSVQLTILISSNILFCDTFVTLLWHFCDTSVTLLWHFCDTSVTLLWHFFVYFHKFSVFSADSCEECTSAGCSERVTNDDITSECVTIDDVTSECVTVIRIAGEWRSSAGTASERIVTTAETEISNLLFETISMLWERQVEHSGHNNDFFCKFVYKSAPANILAKEWSLWMLSS